MMAITTSNSMRVKALRAPARWFASRRYLFISRVIIQVIDDRRVRLLFSYPPGPCPFLANCTRCSGVKSVKRRFGSGGRSIWPGLAWLFVRWAGSVWEALGNAAALVGSKLGARGVLEPTPMPDLWNECVRQADRPSHNPPPNDCLRRNESVNRTIRVMTRNHKTHVQRIKS